jgi:hypothetical protein
MAKTSQAIPMKKPADAARPARADVGGDRNLGADDGFDDPRIDESRPRRIDRNEDKTRVFYSAARMFRRYIRSDGWIGALTVIFRRPRRLKRKADDQKQPENDCPRYPHYRKRSQVVSYTFDI